MRRTELLVLFVVACGGSSDDTDGSIPSPLDRDAFDARFPSSACSYLEGCEEQWIPRTHEECVEQYTSILRQARDAEPCFDPERARTCLIRLEYPTEACTSDLGDDFPHRYCFRSFWAEPCDYEELD